MNFFDLHCDTAFELYKRNLCFNNKKLSVTAMSGKHFENWTQTFAIWIKDEEKQAFDLYKRILNDVKSKLQHAPKNLTPIFAVEGGAVIEDCIDKLKTLKNDGIKFMSLTWNGENKIAGGCETEKDVTDFGKLVIEELNKHKIATDLSHLNKKSFYSAIEHADFPIATHSNCYEICPHHRNLTLEQISLISEKNGVIGLTFYPPFLGHNVFEKIYKNIFILCDKGLENHIAIGTDFDGGEMDKSLNKTSKILNLYGYLHEKGLEPLLLDKIFYKNAHNFIAKL